MSPLSRRRFLALSLLGLLGPASPARADVEVRRSGYLARASLLYGALRFELSGAIEETIDRAAGRYSVRVQGKGDGIENQGESTGVLREGRWTPVRTLSRFVVYGRESRVTAAYDWSRRTVEYQSRSETFFLRRLRVVQDTIAVPEGLHVDDLMSATLNHAEGRWPARPDGALVTHVVRRTRGAREGSDDVEAAYRAELVPFVLRVQPNGEGGKPVALIDLTRFSSWAREDDPARIVFGADRRPELVTCGLMLGTAVTIRMTGATG